VSSVAGSQSPRLGVVLVVGLCVVCAATRGANAADVTAPSWTVCSPGSSPGVDGSRSYTEADFGPVGSGVDIPAFSSEPTIPADDGSVEWLVIVAPAGGTACDYASQVDYQYTNPVYSAMGYHTMAGTVSGGTTEFTTDTAGELIGIVITDNNSNTYTGAPAGDYPPDPLAASSTSPSTPASTSTSAAPSTSTSPSTAPTVSASPAADQMVEIDSMSPDMQVGFGAVLFVLGALLIISIAILLKGRHE
jgi:hypothetical protein